MQGEFQETINIKELLKKYPRGLNITEIANALHMHRNTCAKYLDMLRLKGDVDRKLSGTARNYFLVQRMPLSALLRFTPGPAIIFDSRKEIAMVNKPALSLFKCPLDFMYGEKLQNLPYQLFKDSTIEDLTHQAVQGMSSVADRETYILGKKHNLCLHFIPVIFDSGKEGCALVIYDNTEFIENSEKLNICRRQYEAVTSDQTEFIVHIDTDQTIIFVNDAYCRYLGRSYERLCNLRFVPMFQSDERERVQNILSSLTPENPSGNLDVKSIQKDGGIGFEQWTFRAIFKDNKDIAGYHAIGRNTTELKKSESQLRQYYDNLEKLIQERTKELREVNKRLLGVISEKEEIEKELLFTQFAFDNASDSIILFDDTGSVYKANKTAGELLGYSCEEMRKCSVFDINPSISGDEWRRMWSDAHPGKKDRTISIHAKKDGKVFDVDVSRTFVRFLGRMYFCSIAREI
ncbi:MAG: PAS domain S-box protein [Methanomicrobiaceae archaeon]|nr:PAS domain S-box protein [Methanomicrobiaceae archaeon]